jgi:hypothetical protein
MRRRLAGGRRGKVGPSDEELGFEEIDPDAIVWIS